MSKIVTLGIFLLTFLPGLYSQEPAPPKQKPAPGFSMNETPFSAVKDPNEPVTFHNPVIPGFWSDPSVCRVGEDYYLVNSTFEYFPGVPVFHSKDLVNWELIGYCIDRATQLPTGLNIFATTIRYHEGTFYMITTNLAGGGNFYVTATNPAGPWSDPIFIKAEGIDPDLFFDDDGKTYVISSTFELYEIDLKTGKFLTGGWKIFNGNGGRYAEGPHIYKKDGFYYLMDAEGGTEEAHSETIARSKDIWGPYNPNPANPILAHANAAGQGNPIQGVGHADMVQAQEGSWWMVFHGYRSVGDGTNHILGRETCLAPVTWPKHGWLVVNGNGTVTVDMTCPTLPLKPFPAQPTRNEFDSDKLPLEWNFLRYPVMANYSLTERKGYLRISGSEQTIEDQKSPTFVGKRIQAMNFTASTQVDFNPGANDEAGMTLLNNGAHFDILIRQSNGKRVLVSRLRFGVVVHESEEVVLKPGPVKLAITCNRLFFSFSYAQGDEAFKDIEKVNSKFLSSETAGGFTGLYVGLYATGNGKPSRATADYDWFELLYQ
jgi:alpha-N-arabinofuranosidase